MVLLQQTGRAKKKTGLTVHVKDPSVSLQRIPALLLGKQEKEEKKVRSYSKTINHDKSRGGR